MYNDNACIKCLRTLHGEWIIPPYSEGDKDHSGYTVQRLKDLPKLHKAVWNNDLVRVRTVLAGLKKKMYIDYFDKEHR